jgi:hypothetical protein
MEKNTNKIGCTPNKCEEGVVKSLLQMCKDTNSATLFKMTLDGDYEVCITVRKKGFVAADEFTLAQFKAIKAMATEMKAKAREEDQELYQDIIEKCNLNIAGLTHDDAD